MPAQTVQIGNSNVTAWKDQHPESEHNEDEMLQQERKMTGCQTKSRDTSINPTLHDEEYDSSLPELESLLTKMECWNIEKDIDHVPSDLMHIYLLVERGNSKIWVRKLKENKIIANSLKAVIEHLSENTETEHSGYIAYLMGKLIEPAKEEFFPNRSYIKQFVDSRVSSQSIHIPIAKSKYKDVSHLIDDIGSSLFYLKKERTISRPKEEDIIREYLTLLVNRAMQNICEQVDIHQKTFLNALLVELDYDMKTNNFCQLLTFEAVERFIKNANEEQKKYREYKGNNERNINLQSYLILLLSQNINKTQNSQNKLEIFGYCVDPIRHQLLPEIEYVVTRFENAKLYDFGALKKEVNDLIQERKPRSMLKQWPLFYVLWYADVQNNKSVELEKVPSVSTDVRKIFNYLGLCDSCLPMIQFQQVVSFTHKDTPQLSANKIAYMMVDMILMNDYRFRNFADTSLDNQNEDSHRQSMNDVLNNLYGSSSENDVSNQDMLTEKEKIHPLDGVIAVLACSDFKLRNFIIFKMFVCKVAIPILYQSLFDRLIHFSTYPLRFLTLECKDCELNVATTGFKTISFLRIDRPSVSKSKHINELLRDIPFDTFTHKDSPNGSKQKYISNGTVEATWFIPSSKNTDFYNEPLMLLNLRGNAKHFEKQVQFMTEISTVFVLFVDLKHAEIALAMFGNHPKIILILTIDTKFRNDELLEELCKRYKIITTLHHGNIRNSDDMKKEITSNLRNILNGFGGKLIDIVSCVKCLKKNKHFIQNVYFDEDTHEFTSALKSVETIIEKAKLLQDNKKCNPMPLQKKWEEIRQEEKKYQNEEDLTKKDELQLTINRVRREQFDLCSDISRANLKFAEVILHSSGNDTKLLYFLNSLTIKQEELMHSANRIGDCKLSHRCIEAFTDKDRLFREIGQIYEALNTSDSTNHSEIKLLSEKLPTAAANLLLNGVALELMDGNTESIPIVWINAVFENLRKKTNNSKIAIISVIGIQSSGKSTLLNTMFGLQLAVSAGRCTSGVSMQVLRVNDEKLYDFNYVLILDTEGLRSTDIPYNCEYVRDNRMATFVIGMGDVTIVNIKGENHSEIGDVLQIVAHAFLRLKRVDEQTKLRKTCIFVHQNVSAPNAKQKLLSEKKMLRDQLDKMTKIAAEIEKFQEIHSFKQIIDFEFDKHCFYFPDLWHGAPPMATISTEYCEQVRAVKYFIFQTLSTSRSCLSVSSIRTMIGDLWDGISSDNFVFYFRNTLEMKATTGICTVFQNLKYNLIKLGHAEETRWSNETDKDNIGEFFRLLDTKFERELETLIKEFEDFYDKSDLKHYQIKWKQIYIVKLNHAKNDILETTKKRITDSREENKINEKRKSFSLERFVTNAARNLAEKNEKLDDDLLVKEFNDNVWEVCRVKLLPGTKLLDDELEKQIGKELSSHLQQDHQILNKYLKIEPLATQFVGDKLEGSLDIKILPKCLITGKKFGKGSYDLTLTRVINDLFLSLDKSFKDKDTFLGNKKFNIIHIIDIFREIDEFMYEYENTKLHGSCFTKDLKVILTVHVTKFAIKKFKAMNANYKEKYREEPQKQFLKLLFFDIYKNKQKAEICVNLFYSSLKCIATEHIKLKIQDKMELIISSTFEDKQSIINMMHKLLLEKGNYDLYLKYIENPSHQSMKTMFDFCENYFFDSEKRYLKIGEDFVHGFVNRVRECICHVTESKDTGMLVVDWISDVVKHFKEFIPVEESRFERVSCACTSIENISDFQRYLNTYLDSMEKELLIELGYTSSKTITWPRGNPFSNIFNKVWGCEALCPFCNEPCQFSDIDHLSSGQKHKCFGHRPLGVRGIKRNSKNMLSIYPCSYMVNSGEKYKCSDYNFTHTGCNDKCKNHKYATYKELFQDWHIDPSKKTNDSTFWCYFLYANRSTLMKKFNAGKEINFPYDWPIDKADILKLLGEK